MFMEVPGLFPDDTHAFSTTACGTFQKHWKANFKSFLHESFGGLVFAVVSGNQWDTWGFAGQNTFRFNLTRVEKNPQPIAGRYLVTNREDTLWLRSDEYNAMFLAFTCEISIFTQEPVPRMDGYLMKASSYIN